MTLQSVAPLCKPLINGHWKEVVDVRDRGLAYGDGVFETVLCFQGEMPLWALHERRLQRGCDRLKIPCSTAEISQQLQWMLDELKRLGTASAVIKIMVTRGIGGAGYIPSADPLPCVIIQALPHHPSEAAYLGVPLVELNYRLPVNPCLAGIKHLNRLDYVLAATELSGHPPGTCGLLQDAPGNVVESLHQNIFIVSGGRLFTPQLDKCGVEGVMREKLLAQQEFSAEACTVTREDLCSADEIFLCSAVRGIWPVTAYAGRRLLPGAVTRALQQGLAREWGAAYGE